MEEVRKHLVLTIARPLYGEWGHMGALEEMWAFIATVVSNVLTDIEIGQNGCTWYERKPCCIVRLCYIQSALDPNMVPLEAPSPGSLPRQNFTCAQGF